MVNQGFYFKNKILIVTSNPVPACEHAKQILSNCWFLNNSFMWYW